MIEIINEQGQILELGDQTIAVARHNPLFNDADKFFGDITLPGKAPLSPANKAFIQNGHLVEAANDVYEFPVQVKYMGVPFFLNALFNYRIADQIDFTLKLNFGAISNKVKKTRLTEIGTFDAEYNIPDADFRSRMKDTLLNPADYPYAFFPVHNDRFTEKIANPDAGFPYLNYFNYATQAFETGQSAGYVNISAECPFYKLTYVLKQVINYLGLKPAGSFFDEPGADEIYIYTQRALIVASTVTILPSMVYMPNMTIADFFKQIRKRLQLSFDFDLATAEVYVESSSDVLSAIEPFNIAPFIERIEELERPATGGISVTLKPDESDELYNVGTAEKKEFLPVWRLTIGDGTQDEVLDAGTLKEHVEAGRISAASDQLIFRPNLNTYPDFPQETSLDESTRNNWPLRFIRFAGMIEQEPGKYWPQSNSLDLTETEGEWYSFLYNSKPVTAIANIPYNVLARLKATTRLSAIGNEGNYFTLLPEAIKYDLGGKAELIPVKIEGRALNYAPGSVVSLARADQKENPPEGAVMQIKASYADLTEIVLEVLPGATEDPGDAYTVEPIREPCDEYGVGGQSVWVHRVQDVTTGDIRIRCAVKPNYMQRLGVRYAFTLVDGLYETTVNDYDKFFISPYWIVF